ncbi:helix-turn-helix domain-containing protein [Clostridium sp. SHJSY1]|uniref:helix-turn-helix domain-containing protein n=1 Tax=Clostridium sp. SHJSY1 TaxID=2942483 RepID=UPI002874DD6B|nr:helix-turn-helix domain-containing protein [Clostridium sp. SHJSY1]MDS0528312.1 helix-turn-helix domain-containing protein [Clostridium sp. SHJSY1]
MGRKPTFDKNQAIELYAKGLGFRAIAKILNCKEDAVEKCIKRNAPELVKQRKMKITNKKILKLKKEEELILTKTNLLNKEDLKEIANGKKIGINKNETISVYSFIKWNRQSYIANKENGKLNYDNRRGAKPFDVPGSF